MKRNSLFLLLLLLAVCAWSVPARRATFTHTQKDGTVLTLMLVGDEHMHYYQNTATGEAMELHPDGDYYLIAPATLSARQQQADQRRAEANDRRIQRLPRMAASTPDGMKKSIGSYNNMQGTKKGLVILVNFQDKQFVTCNPQQAYYNQFNQEGYNANGHIGSVKDYFTAQSYGQFTVDFDVVGPVTVSQNMAYYGAPSGSDNDSHPAEMIIEAVNLANTQCGVDYSQYDWSGDGNVDQVFVVFAGYNQAQGASENTIWPHEWNLYSANYFGDGAGPQYIDGKWIDTYACSSELAGSSGSTMDGIGTACHEFSHCLGYPDMYDTDYTGTNGEGTNMEYFDVMASGSYNGMNACGEVPCGYSAYERWMAGWMVPEELTRPTSIEGMKSIAETGSSAYLIYNDNNRNEYFILENRQNDGWFRYCRNYVGVHGMLITHVDYDQNAWRNNKVNVDANHQRFTYVAADGDYSIMGNNGYYYLNKYASDLFPGTSNVTAFTNTSHLSAGGALFNGTSPLDKPVTNIAEVNGLINFDFMGGALYTITYNNCRDVTTWTQPSKGQSTTLPEAEIEVPNFTFVGWATAQVEETADLPTLLTGTYTPTDDITLYAVYYNNKVYTSNPDAYIPHGGTEDAQLYFPYIIRVGDTFAGAKLNTDSDGSLTYESSNPAVATVDPDTGEVTALTVGTAIITVTQSETTSYLPATAKYMVKVIGISE